MRFVGFLVLGALVLTAQSSRPVAQAQAPSKAAYKGVVTPIGPYSPGVGIGGTVYLSGQIGLDPATNQMVEGGTEAQAKRVMENLGAVLKGAGLGYEHLVKCSIYISNLQFYAEVSRVYLTFFPGIDPPARETVGVKELPRGVNVEISGIAIRG